MNENNYDLKELTNKMLSQLDDYRKELGLTGLTLDNLIDSHRYQRDIMGRTTENNYEEYKKIREEKIKDLVLNSEYISINKLRNMTIRELIDLLGE